MKALNILLPLPQSPSTTSNSSNNNYKLEKDEEYDDDDDEENYIDFENQKIYVDLYKLYMNNFILIFNKDSNMPEFIHVYHLQKMTNVILYNDNCLFFDSLESFMILRLKTKPASFY